jgi:hypothetical protein
MPISLSASSRSLQPSVFIVFSLYTYTDALEKLSLHSLHKRRHDLDAHFFFLKSIVTLKPARLFWKMLAFVFLPSIIGTSHSLVFVPLINTAILFGAPMLPTQWVKISIYFQSEPFPSITFILINLKLLIMFVHTPNVLFYVVLVASRHLHLFVCLFVCLFVYFSALICFPPVLTFN